MDPEARDGLRHVCNSIIIRLNLIINFYISFSANTAQIDKAKELVKKLQFAFHSESFENPALQQHYANVEAMALERDAPEEVTDFTRTSQILDLFVLKTGCLLFSYHATDEITDS